MNANYEFVLGVAWVAYVIGVAAASVGTQSTPVVYEWHFPFLIGMVFGGTFLLSIVAGRKSK